MQQATYKQGQLCVMATGRAWLEIVSHPEHAQGKIVITSPVVSFDEGTGVLITHNTTYTPEVQQ